MQDTIIHNNKIVNVNDIRIIFDEPTHTYTDNLGRVYTSATTIIGNYHEKFDEEYWARRKAKERGVSIDTIKDEWERERNDACNHGNEKHNFIEDSINSFYDKKEVTAPIGSLQQYASYKVVDYFTLSSSPLREKFPVVYAKLVQLIEAGYTLYAEYRLFHPIYLISGTIDLVAIKGNEFIIIDWKTNKNPILFKAGYFKKEWKNLFGKWQKVKTDIYVYTDKRMYSPIDHLQDCLGIHYNIQLSIYSRILEYWGFIFKGMAIYHFQRNGITKLIHKDLKYLKNDVDLIFEHHANR